MDIKDLAKLLADQEVTGYSTVYFNRVSASYQAVIENVVMAQNRKFEHRVVWEFSIIENDGTEGANDAGDETKIILSLEPWDLEKTKRHLQGILGVNFSTMEKDQQEQLIAESLEPREDKDGKSVLSGIPVMVKTRMVTSPKREAEGKEPYLDFTITKR